MSGNDRAVLACASSGGHFTQLLHLIGRMPDVGRVTWLTYDSGFVAEMLSTAGRCDDRVVFASYAAPRDLRNLLGNAMVARALLQRERFDLAVSTGAGIAVSALPQARAMGVRACYIESATRVSGPSLTGAILQRVPGVELYSQNGVFGPRWRSLHSVHDDFVPGPPQPVRSLRRVVVTLGTIAPYSFRRAVERLVRVLPRDADVLWQTGATDVSDLGIDPRERVPAAELTAAMREADVVVAHAGTGTALTAFELGRAPVLLPRRARFGEHVDDHQVGTAQALSRRGLATYLEVEDVTTTRLVRAGARTVRRAPQTAVGL